MEEGSHDETVLVSLAGRVLGRVPQRKWMFYDLHGAVNNFDGTEEHFRNVHAFLRRGSIVGVVGNSGKSKKGELSIFPKSIVLLVPCLHMLPTSHSGLKIKKFVIVNAI